MVTPPRTPPGLQNTGSLVAPDTAAAAAAISPFSSRQHYFPYTLDFQRGRIIPNLHRGFIFYLYIFLWYQLKRKRDVLLWTFRKHQMPLRQTVDYAWCVDPLTILTVPTPHCGRSLHFSPAGTTLILSLLPTPRLRPRYNDTSRASELSCPITTSYTL